MSNLRVQSYEKMVVKKNMSVIKLSYKIKHKIFF